LNNEEHERNNITRELIGSFFNKLSTLSAGLVHVCGTEIRVAYAIWLTKLSLSKHTTGADPVSLARYCSSKILSISAVRHAGSVLVSTPWSSNLKIVSRLNWSYFVNTAITGTAEIPSCPQLAFLPKSWSWTYL
jgi:hypothetical protein